jgi:hypothetical protein
MLHGTFFVRAMLGRLIAVFVTLIAKERVGIIVAVTIH